MFNYYKTDFKKTRKTREPVYSLTEFAKKVGIPRSTLDKRMKESAAAPSVEMKNKNTLFYKLSDLEKWHAEYDA